MFDDAIYVSTKKQKGRSTKDPVERLRVTIWYLAVRARKGWSDYRLDQEFAWETSKEERRGADRLRVFEGIRRRQSEPSFGKHPRCQFDLIARVDAHPDFAGTAAIFHSPYWTLLKCRHLNLKQSHDFAKQQMERSGLSRVSEALEEILRTEVYGHADEKRMPRPSHEAVYKLFLELAIKNLPPDLDLLALIGSLFREAYLVCALETALILKNKFIDLVDHYSCQAWITNETRTTFVDMADARVCFWQMADNYWGKGVYDDWPTSVVQRWPVKLDKEMLDLIAREDELYEDLIRRRREYAQATKTTSTK